MKILGKTGNGIIAEISMREFANICGFAYEGAPDFLLMLRSASADGEHGEGIRIGAKVPIGEWWRHFASIRQNENQIKCEAARLRTLTELLEQPLALISAPEAGEE